MKSCLVACLAFGLLYSAGAKAQPAPSPNPELKSGSPTFMIGVAVDFGGTVNTSDIGLTAKILSSNRSNDFVVGGGVSYFPWADKDRFGLDLSAGYNFDQVAALGGYDILRGKPQLSLGYVPTRRTYDCPSGWIYDNGDCQGILSDSRLKRDIQLVAVRDDGMKLYSFKYLWSDEIYVGVMAQDLLRDARWANAVVIRENGYYAVRYQDIGLRMTTFAKWQAEGMRSVQLVLMAPIQRLKKAA